MSLPHSLAHLLHQPVAPAVGIQSASDFDEYVAALNREDWELLRTRFWARNLAFSQPGQPTLSSVDVLIVTMQRFRRTWDRQIRRIRWLGYHPGGRTLAAEVEVELSRKQQSPSILLSGQITSSTTMIWAHYDLDDERRVSKIRLIPEPERTIGASVFDQNT
ncbi:hypothetical protein BT69DRAFT_1321326 [Atractiella rhizophila]|nr:hypothetical protein BT69DRAFT_1321326 [Atractiella rhizophila]